VLLLLKPDYKRMKAEEKILAERILNSTAENSS
jgi:hypothetical protein